MEMLRAEMIDLKCRFAGMESLASSILVGKMEIPDCGKPAPVGEWVDEEGEE